MVGYDFVRKLLVGVRKCRRCVESSLAGGRIPGGGAVFARLAEEEAQLLQLLRKAVLGRHGGMCGSWSALGMCGTWVPLEPTSRSDGAVVKLELRLALGAAAAQSALRPTCARCSRRANSPAPDGGNNFLRPRVSTSTDRLRRPASPIAPLPASASACAPPRAPTEHRKHHVVPSGLPHLQRLPALLPPAAQPVHRCARAVRLREAMEQSRRAQDGAFLVRPIVPLPLPRCRSRPLNHLPWSSAPGPHLHHPHPTLHTRPC